MKTDSIDVAYVAKLARLELSAEEAAVTQEKLSQILVYVEQLGKLDVSAIEPTAHAFEATNVFRADVSRPSLSVEEALLNAPDKQDDLFKVPKVVE
jgi:aspartyl-tRNA(Asn)/glutamyl-tRNA(Gln) amidotransferase subunit C